MSVPLPILVSPPLPVKKPGTVTVLPWVSNVPVTPVPSRTFLEALKLSVPAACKVPLPVKLRVPAVLPSAVSAVICSVPAASVVPPP